MPPYLTLEHSVLRRRCNVSVLLALSWEQNPFWFISSAPQTDYEKVDKVFKVTLTLFPEEYSIAGLLKFKTNDNFRNRKRWFPDDPVY